MDDKNRPEFRVSPATLQGGRPPEVWRTSPELDLNRKSETKNPKPETPLMRQYLDLKARHPTEILLFRLGDFYEMFFEDAQKAAPILEVALTQRQGTPMCGVPAHALDPYVAKLLKAGIRVAIADQMEEPSGTKALVRRDVVRVMTAGTLQEDTLLASKKCNYLVALSISPDGAGLATLECSTGEFLATELLGATASQKAWDEITRLSPSEVLLNSAEDYASWKDRLSRDNIAIAALDDSDFSPALAEERLKKIYGIASIRGLGLENKKRALSSAGAIVRYLEKTQCGRPTLIRTLKVYDLSETLLMDSSTIDHLDLLPKNSLVNSRSRSLLDVLDQTLTPMGGRLLRRWVVAPLRKLEAIRDRQDKVEFFYEGREWRRILRASLQGWPDLERILVRMCSNTAGPRDYAALGQGLRRLPKIKAQLEQFQSRALATGEAERFGDFPEDPTLSDLLERAVADTPPNLLKDGGVIRPGYDPELDEVRSWIQEGKSRLLELEKQEKEQTGIPSLKVGFNNVFGYFIEVTKVHLSKVPMHYIRKQTTAHGERYITPELKEFETRILGAEERALRLENVLVNALREEILKHADLLQTISLALSELDIFVSLAEVAERRRYIRPKVDESDHLMIREGRHPVLEDILPSGTLVPNDVDLRKDSASVIILTGPNMSGKSTYLRQTALITLMAQMGSFVPASEARIGIMDQLFTRIGASDRLTEGESTFMVEMVETARILNYVTPRSLVILDEVGRGTSTYDGISIAWACLEYLRQKGPKVLFATHYFELTQLAQKLSGVSNAHVSARDWGGDVVFLHKVEPGPGDRSFGIHVAKLAGVPKPVLERAEVLLKSFEMLRDQTSPPIQTRQPDLFGDELPIGNAKRENDIVLPAWVQELAQLDLDHLTPIEALLKLKDWKEKHRT